MGDGQGLDGVNKWVLRGLIATLADPRGRRARELCGEAAAFEQRKVGRRVRPDGS